MSDKLQIGTKVVVRATVTFGYYTDSDLADLDDLETAVYTRRAFRQELDKPLAMQITGGSNRPIGVYRDGVSLDMIDGPDYTPPRLEVTGTVFVYHARVGLLRKEQFVLPEDLSLFEEPIV